MRWRSLTHTWSALRARRATRWALDLAMVALVLVAVQAWQTRAHLRGDAPDLELRDLDGRTVTLASLAGKPVMVAFFAPWCGVCRANEGAVAQLARVAGEQAHVVSVASDYRGVDEIRAYVDEHHVPAPVLLGGNGTARAWRVQAFPTYYFLDERGRVTGSSVGYTTTAGMAARLFALP